jgi:ribosomal protein S12 methylthiotransferase accessory factor
MSTRRVAEALAAWSNACAAIGVTRLAQATDLDTIGVPVWHAVRPRSRNLTVTQGKGIRDSDAIAGAVMEAAELFVSEEPRVDEVLPAGDVMPELTYRLDELGGFVSAPPSRRRLAWSRGRFLDTGEMTLVPVEAIRLDFTGGRLCRPIFIPTSTGLAAGHYPADATRHALYEVVERHCVRVWARRSASASPLRIDESDQVIGDLVARVRAAGLTLRVDDCTEIGVPCAIARLSGPDYATVFIGSGCDTTLVGAVRRAVLEAVQSRMTNIVGARDDIAEVDYLPAYEAACGASSPGSRTPRESDEDSNGGALSEVTCMIADPVEPIGPIGPIGPISPTAAIAECLRHLGSYRPIVVDLSRPDVPVLVHRVLVPGLLGPR